jgi:hypothetical protein
VRLLSLHNMAFRAQNPRLGEDLKLISASTSGVGFLKNSSTVWPAKGSSIDGELVIEGSWYPHKLRVAYFSDVVVGCAFQNPAPEFLQLLRRHFEAEFSALELQEVNPKLLRHQGEGEMRAFLGDNCEVSFVSGPAGIERFQLIFLGNYVEGGERLRTRFGSLLDNFESSFTRESDLIEWDEFPSEELIDMSLRFVENIGALGRAERKAIRSLLTRVRGESR